MRVMFSSISALVIGLLQFSLIVFCISFFALHFPISAWLAHNGFGGTKLLLGVTVVEFPMHVVLWLPAGYLLLRLRPLPLWVYLALALVPTWVWINRLVLFQGEFSPIGSMLLSWVPELVAPVVATLVVAKLIRPQMPNNSFKPKPLRGSA